MTPPVHITKAVHCGRHVSQCLLRVMRRSSISNSVHNSPLLESCLVNGLKNRTPWTMMTRRSYGQHHSGSNADDLHHPHVIHPPSFRSHGSVLESPMGLLHAEFARSCEGKVLTLDIEEKVERSDSRKSERFLCLQKRLDRSAKGVRIIGVRIISLRYAIERKSAAATLM